MLSLKIEGPRREVNAFIQDIKNNPQARVITQSMPYFEEVLENQDVTSYCHLQYYSLEEIGKAMVVTFETKEGEDITLTLEYGKVLKIGDVLQINGKVKSLLPAIAW
ncbi:hypothetical protein [Lihuaxuella thermophila]|uniref:Uncharacterized protein n=1 Tax=Lihuaxuella thermophila TaxID=1173111 RepID=A0A1H8D6P8_9BACL|nr:hypothetical protein [Lihuaxuella thermophila]SEN02862.1 hypothetical protein SAMN05444955_10513 [Lihuaxuella thermophila]